MVMSTSQELVDERRFRDFPTQAQREVVFRLLLLHAYYGKVYPKAAQASSRLVGQRRFRDFP